MPTKFRSKRSSSSTQDDQANRIFWMTSSGTTSQIKLRIKDYKKNPKSLIITEGDLNKRSS